MSPWLSVSLCPIIDCSLAISIGKELQGKKGIILHATLFYRYQDFNTGSLDFLVPSAQIWPFVARGEKLSCKDLDTRKFRVRSDRSITFFSEKVSEKLPVFGV